MATADLLLHPVRLRIVQCLLGGRTLTTAQLQQEMPDVAPATLYRQVATLLEGEVVAVAEERRVRGAVERGYRLREPAPSVGADEARAMTLEEHRRGFATFVAALLADFDRYLERGDVDLGRDLVGYRQAALYLSDAEMQELLTDLRAVFAGRLDNPPAPGRTRRLVSTIVVPDSRREV